MQDFFARDAVYHNVCFSNFRSGLQIPRVFAKEEPPRKKLCFGRPENQQCLDAFTHVIDYTEQVTISDLVKLMESKLDGGQAYTNKYLKKKLLDHYGNNVIIAEKKEQQMWLP
ncbi:hypothetical protein ACOMHN_015077 [Nucella lapillus]